MSETGLFLNKIPYIKGGSGSKTMIFFAGGSALLGSLTESSMARYLGVLQEYVPAGYTYYVFGYEEHSAENYTLGQIIDDFARIIKEVTGPAVIAGISFGGFAAMRFAARYPELTKRLVLLITAHRFSKEGEGKVRRMLELAKAHQRYALRKEFTLLFRRPWFTVPARFLLWKDRAKLAGGQLPDPATLRSLENLLIDEVPKNTGELHNIRAETLVIGGTRDQFFGVEEFRQTAETIPGARLRLFAGETHMLPVERKRDVSKEVHGFLARPDTD